MSRKKDIDLDLTGFAELFMNDEGRAESRLPRIYDIPLSEIDDFPNHPFKVKMDEDMNQLVQSVKERGIITPVTLRQKEDGRYEIVSGHRRRKACELAGLERVPAEIKELSRDEAIILMVESNLQRSIILPSEKAFSYKMRLEAMKRQAGRPPKDNYSPVGNNLAGTTSSELMAEQIGESKNQIYRYIRLTELIPELLDMVDENKIAFRPAVELSYLTETEQHNLLNSISYNDATPSLPQAIRLKEFSKAGKLSAEVIEAILGEEKPNQKEKISFKAERLRPYIELLSTTMDNFTGMDYYIWITQGGGLKCYQDMYGKYNMTYFPIMINHAESGIRSTKPITSIKDMQSMKIRLGGVMAGRAAEKLGINITTVAASELYESLQRGVIDGGEFSTPCSDDSLKLQEVAKYWCSPAWYQSGGVNGVMINKDAWNKLPEEYQNAIQMAAEICTSEQLSRYLWMDFDSTKKMLEEDGCVVTKMNQDDWNTIRETCRQVYEEEAAKNENFNMVYSSMQDYREHADTYRAMLGDYGWGFNYDESEK